MDNEDSALHYYNKAIALSDSINYPKGMADAYANMSGVYSYPKNYAKAIEYANKAFNIYKNLDDKYRQSYILKKH